MDAITSIRERYGFEFPELYRTLLAKGHFSTTPWENFLDLQDCEWLSLEDIASYEFLDFQITSDGGFVPLAISARRDEFCWRLDWATGAEPPIVFCERGESGFGYAPHFQGFLYRKALESFGGYDGPDSEKDLKRLRHAVDIISPYLPGAWSGQLLRLAQRDFAEWKRGKLGEVYLFPKEELKAVIAEHLAFAHLDEKFVQDKELLARRAKQ
jgi:hypothetical protein